MLVMGIDPGVSVTGAVLMQMDNEEILDAATVSTKAGGSRTEQVVERARVVSERLIQLVVAWRPEAIVIEGFKDIAPLRLAKRRYYTPILIGVLDTMLRGCSSYPKLGVHYQDPEVKGPYKDYKTYWSHKVHLIPGDSKLTNDHLRDAAIHALHFHP